MRELAENLGRILVLAAVLAAAGRLGAEEFPGNLQGIYEDLGAPAYGNLQFAPRWATVQGAARNDAQGIPHITVEFRNASVYVTSTSNLTIVKLEFASGNQQSWSPTGSTTGTFQGSGSNSGKQIRKVWIKSENNANQFGPSGEYFDFTSSGINATLNKALGLTSAAYPYAGGSWDNYLDWVQSSSNSNAAAGWRYKFGAENLIAFWLESQAPIPSRVKPVK